MEPYLEVISMLVKEHKITLFTTSGEMIHIATHEVYDTAALIAYLTPRLTGTDPVELLLSDYYLANKALSEEDGILTTMTIDGHEVEGVFYPRTQGVRVKTAEANVIIPDIAPLKDQIIRAGNENSDAVKNFLMRLAPVIASRNHSGTDLLTFIQNSEMPLTHSGMLIAYKRVNKSADGYYVDCHSGRIRQRIGSRVSMPVDMVDTSRHNSCSTGLHVANLDYLSTFHGTNTMVVLVDPANFIAVPMGEDAKARVCSYDIIGVISNDAHLIISSGNHTEDGAFEQLISDAVQGLLPPPFEEIIVGDKRITDVIPLENAVPPEEAPPEEVKPAPSGKSLRTDAITANQKIARVKRHLLRQKGIQELDDNVIVAFQMLADFPDKSVYAIADELDIAVVTLNRWINEHDYNLWLADYLAPKKPEVGILPVEEAEPVKRTKMQQIAHDLYEAWEVTETSQDLYALLKFKKERKKGWPALGFTDEQIDKINSCIT